MKKQSFKLYEMHPEDICFGFRMIKKQYVSSCDANLYTLKHEQTGAELLYFDRDDENKTFSIAFKTLPEDNTGVFHILEHSVLNGSKKFPVKEPFVSMLQGSMQTFLNAMTFNDKTVYPVSSRNDKDFFNLMSVYLDAVFSPLIYERPEIFMQEGWHYEFESEDSQPYFNGVVYSEMKGAYAEVDTIISDETNRMLFPDNSYGYVSGGHPEHIPLLSYQQFLDTHKRFYHPSNSKIFLDGHMDIDAVLRYIDEEYLSKYRYLEPDFDFTPQIPKTAKKTVYYEAQNSDENLAHMSIAKILCSHNDTETLYAAKILADYLTGSNEAPLTRAFLENGLAQDISLEISEEGAFQPTLSLIIRNTDEASFLTIKDFLPQAISQILSDGLDKASLIASIERFAFMNKEITEPYGIELALKALDGWLYGDDPLTHIDNSGIFESLRSKVDTDYFSNLMSWMLLNPDDKSYLYVLPSTTKGIDDANKEREQISDITSTWDDNKRRQVFEAFMKMQQWQQSTDSEEVLSTLPSLHIEDIPKEIKPTATSLSTISGSNVLKVDVKTNGIVYLNLFFDISDFSIDELRTANLLAACLGELSTENYSAHALQSKIKTLLGSLSAKIELLSKPGDLKNCRPYLLISASILEENITGGIELLKELLTSGRYNESDKIYEAIVQIDYMLKQSLISNGHAYAITKSLSAFSKEGALKELLEGESFNSWFTKLSESFSDKASEYSAALSEIASKAFSLNRLFIGYSGNLLSGALSDLISAFPNSIISSCPDIPGFDTADTAISIPAGVGFSALGNNLYAINSQYTGSYAVLSSLLTYTYLWNMVRVQGGAYGTGMNVRTNGDIFCYSYRDPNLENTRKVYIGMADFLDSFLSQDAPLDDIIIGTVNTIEPLLSPRALCQTACTRFLKGITHESIIQIRKDILNTSSKDLAALSKSLKDFAKNGKFCAVGDSDSISFTLNK